MIQIHYGCPAGAHAAESCDNCDTCRKAGNLGLCSSGTHVWIDEVSAAKCCNGFRSELVIVRERADLAGLRSVQYEEEAETHYGFRWTRMV